ncbi:MAG: PD-(D/E)XK nuclease family protein, partial [Clostridiales bacterium]|nr:PD-(D/E)XK nuclease family protein [Clostridiales bacterium]
DTAADTDRVNDTGDGEGDGDGDGAGGSGADGDADGEARENESNAIYEARLVAQKIAELMCSARSPDPDGFPAPDGLPRPLAYRDMVVLMRAVEGSAVAFTDELNRLGVPAYTDSGAAYFETYEITVMLSLLRIIDNPLQDIPLLTALLSPVFSFTPEQVALIRRRAKSDAGTGAGTSVETDAGTGAGIDAGAETEIDVGGAAASSAAPTAGPSDAEPADFSAVDLTLYDCVRADPSPRSRAVIESIGDWRELAAQKPVSALIWHLMHSTDFYAHASAMPGGAQRGANLRQLFEYALQYEMISYKGIFNFLRFIDRMIAQGGDFAGAKLTGEGADTVRVMSIHKSKGLEFPVVFLAGCGKRFNLSDAGDKVLLHRTAGFGPNYVDLERRIIDDTLAKKLIGEQIRAESISEEMRILYVALTRAKNRLFLVGTLADAARYEEKLERLRSSFGDLGGKDGGGGAGDGDRREDRGRRPAGSIDRLPPEYVRRADGYLFWLLSVRETEPPVARFFWHTSADEALAGTAVSDENGERPAEMGIHPDAPPDVSDTPAVPDNVPAASDGTGVFSDLVPNAPDMLAVPAAPTVPAAPDFETEAEIGARLSWSYPHPELALIPRKVSVTEIGEARTAARRFLERGGEPGFSTERAAFFEDAVYLRSDALAVPAFLSGTRGFTRAEVGTFTHLVLEKADFRRDAETQALEALILRLVETGVLLPEQAAAVDRGAILSFFASEAGRLAAGAENLHRETVFTVRLTLAEYRAFTEGSDTAPSASPPVAAPAAAPVGAATSDAASGDAAPPAFSAVAPADLIAPPSASFAGDAAPEPFVLLQGSVDCWFTTPQGIVLIDYKTGFAAERDVMDEQFSKYRQQIELYAIALQKITGLKTHRKFICLLSSNKCVEL